MKLKNTYYVVRHGECVFNVLGKGDFSGNPDNFLTEKGKLQIQSCAENLKHENVAFEKIFSSPLIRAKESADIFLNILDVTDKEITVTPLLKEMNHGSERDGQLLTKKEMTEGLEVDFHAPHGDGESFWNVRERVSTLLKELEAKYQDKNILLVTHGSPTWMFYSAAYDLNEKETLEFKNQRKVDSGYFIKNAEPLIIR